jgi:hypothetical protein
MTFRITFNYPELFGRPAPARSERAEQSLLLSRRLLLASLAVILAALLIAQTVAPLTSADVAPGPEGPPDGVPGPLDAGTAGEEGEQPPSQEGPSGTSPVLDSPALTSGGGTMNLPK